MTFTAPCTVHPERPSVNEVWAKSCIDFREPRCQQCFEKASSDAGAQASLDYKRRFDIDYMDDRYDSIHHNDRKHEATFPRETRTIWRGGKKS